MILFHGSSHKHAELKPGIQHTSKKIEWDETESNEFLYATNKQDDAIIFGLFSYIEQNRGGQNFHMDNKKLSADCPAFPLSEATVYLYSVLDKGEWAPVGNKHNGYTREYKTQETVYPLSVKKIDIAKHLRANGYQFTFVTKET